MAEVRIIDVTPPGGPDGVVIWQLETRPSADAPWHRDHTGRHTATDRSQLEQIARNIDPEF